MDAANLKVWLPFDTSATFAEDKLGNTWTAYGTVSIGTDYAKTGNALQLNKGYLRSNEAIEFGGADFTVSFYGFMNSSSEYWAGFFCAQSTTNTESRPGQINFHRDNKSDRILCNVYDSTGQNTADATLSNSYLTNYQHHFELDYSHADSTLKVFVDGELNLTLSTTIERLSRYIFIGANSYVPSQQRMVGTIDEFLLYDGVALHSENFTPPTEADYFALALELDGSVPLTLDFDVERIIKNNRKPLEHYIEFTGNSGCYAELPLDVLAGATTFTIEAKFSTASTKSASDAWQWGTIAGREISYFGKDDGAFCVNDGKLCFWCSPASKGTAASNTQKIMSSAVVNDGAIHKVAVISSNGAIDLYCDGELVAHTDNVNAKITDAQTILIAYNSNSDSLLQMDLYELRFWSVARTEIFATIDGTEEGLQGWYIPSVDGLKDFSGSERHATLYGSPAYIELYNLPVTLIADVQRKLISAVEVTFDVQRKVNQKWRYVNAGTADSLIVTGTTLTNLPESKSNTGTAFYQTTHAKCFDLPATDEIWLKFDVYFDGSNRWRAYNGGSNGTTGITAQTDGEITYFVNDKEVHAATNTAKTNQLQAVLLHMISGSSAGVVEAWVDGEKVYTYTGDVNHGEDFADIYLQSDGAGTFFSNVIISNSEIKFGEGYQIFYFDVERRTSKHSEYFFDVARCVVKPIVIPPIGDHFNHLFLSYLDIYSGGAQKFILPKKSKVYIRGEGSTAFRIFSDTDDTGKIVGSAYLYDGKFYAELDECEEVFIETTHNWWASTYPLLISDGATDSDLNALTDNTRQIFYPDISRNLIRTLEDDFDIFISNVIQVELFADIKRALLAVVNLFTRDKDNFFSDETNPFVNPTSTVPASSYSPPTSADLPINTDGLQNFEVALAEQQLTDQVRFSAVTPFDIMQQVKGQYLDYPYNMRVERVQQQGIIYSCDCCSDIDQLLYTQMAYKIPAMTTWWKIDGEEVGGTPKTVEIQTVYPTASEHVRKIASALHLSPVIQFDDFLSTVLMDEQGGVTYNDLIRDIFGWSSRVPTMLINVFIRDGKLFVIQRGHESHSVDISKAQMTVPVITKELVRTTWGSTPWSKTTTWESEFHSFVPADRVIGQGGQGGGDERVREVMSQFNGNGTQGHTTFKYDEAGRLIQTYTYVYDSNRGGQNTYTTVNNYYDDDGTMIATDTFTQSIGTEGQSTSRSVDEKHYITLPNGEKFLSQEVTKRWQNDSGLSITDNDLVDSRVTVHHPSRVGQSHVVTVSTDGEVVGEAGGQNTGDDRVTPFRNKKAFDFANSFDNATGEWKTQTQETGMTVNGLSLYDSSFPIHDEATLIKVTNALRNLNRKTKETVNVTLYDFEHLIDFDDKIILNGATYFLSSNTARTTPRIKFEQNLSLVRWY